VAAFPGYARIYICSPAQAAALGIRSVIPESWRSAGVTHGFFYNTSFCCLPAALPLEAPPICFDEPPRTFAKSQTHPPAIRTFFFLDFFLSTFLGVSRQGEFKNTIQIFL
jgi:hypothetical protein